MRVRLLAAWFVIRGSYWFLPAVLVGAAVGLSGLTIAVDDGLRDRVPAGLVLVYAGGPDGARALLSTVAGSMITVAALVFSITMVVLSQASSQLGPRVLAWAWQGLLADGASPGAPPDRYNTRGQDWGLAPLVPHRLRGAAYEPFIRTIRATLRHAGGLRIDHVMGLFRLFWIPASLGPSLGACVRYSADELLAIVAVKSRRARAVVVGEDLGTVEEAARRRLAAARVLSYRVLWFESGPPERYPVHALASVSTHDFPTIAGVWTGSDLRAQERLGLHPNEEGFEAMGRCLAAVSGRRPHAEVRDVILGTHRALARAPSALAAASLDDALLVEERPNVPATTEAQRPNWSLALPAPLEEIERDPFVRTLAETVGQGRNPWPEDDRAEPPRGMDDNG